MKIGEPVESLFGKGLREAPPQRSGGGQTLPGIELLLSPAPLVGSYVSAGSETHAELEAPQSSTPRQAVLQYSTVS